MSQLQHDGYGAAIANVLTTELNALADAGKAVSADIDNTSNLNLYDDLELVVTYGSSPTAGKTVDVYLLPSVDGTNFADGDGSTVPPNNTLVGSFTVRATTSAQRLTIIGVALPPGHFKYLVTNNAGVAMAATNNTLKRRAYKLKVA